MLLCATEHNMKTEVKFPISNPISFPAEVSYEHLGITTCMEAGKLSGLKTVVEHDLTAGHDDIVSDARDRVVDLLTLIEYSTGVAPNISEVQTRTTDPESEVSLGLGFIRLAATIVRQVPMPPAELVENLSGGTRMLIGWYIRGQKSESVIDRIKYFYMVLDGEQKRTSQKSLPYKPPQEYKLVRDAVSHTKAGNPDVIAYLKREIQFTVIDPTNESHMQFLEKKVRLIQQEAQRILNSKVPKWW
jgi:hypothetical protein